MKEEIKRIVRTWKKFSDWQAFQLACEYKVDVRVVEVYYLMTH